MKRDMICIQCPQGCGLKIELADGKLVSVQGNKCPRGADYARQEVENPVRTLTSAVITDGLTLKMLPVRTSAPIPKASLGEAMTAIKKLVVKTPVRTGDVLVRGFLGLGVDLVACRPAAARSEAK